MKQLPDNAISLLENSPKKSTVKKYVAVFLILLVTFAIPVTITQFYQNNSPSSLAYTQQKPPSLQSYGVSVSTVSSSPTYLKYWWIAPIGLVLIGVWVYLIILFAKERKTPYES